MNERLTVSQSKKYLSFEFYLARVEFCVAVKGRAAIAEFLFVLAVGELRLVSCDVVAFSLSQMTVIFIRAANWLESRHFWK